MELKSYLKYIVIYVSNVNDIGELNSDPLISNTDSGDVTYLTATGDTCQQSKQIYATHVSHQHTNTVHQHAYKHRLVGMGIKQEYQETDKGPTALTYWPDTRLLPQTREWPASCAGRCLSPLLKSATTASLRYYYYYYW